MMASAGTQGIRCPRACLRLQLGHGALAAAGLGHAGKVARQLLILLLDAAKLVLELEQKRDTTQNEAPALTLQSRGQPCRFPPWHLVVAVEEVVLVRHGGVALSLHLLQLRAALNQLIVHLGKVGHAGPLWVGALAWRHAAERARKRVLVVLVLVHVCAVCVVLGDLRPQARLCLERLEFCPERGCFSLLPLELVQGRGGG